MNNTLYVKDTIDEYNNTLDKAYDNPESRYYVDHFEIRLADSIIKEFGELFAYKLGAILMAASQGDQMDSQKRNSWCRVYPHY